MQNARQPGKMNIKVRALMKIGLKIVILLWKQNSVY